MKIKQLSKIGAAICRAVGKSKLWARRHEPELWVGAGLAIGVGAVVAAGAQGMKCHDILAKRKEMLDSIEETAGYAEAGEVEYTVEDQRHDRIKANAEAAVNCAKKFVGPGVMVVTAGYFIIKGLCKQKARTNAAIKWGMGVASTFAMYRTRNIEKNGAAYDKYCLTGIEEVPTEVTMYDENGKATTTKTVKNEGEVAEDARKGLVTFEFSPDTSYAACYDAQDNMYKLYMLDKSIQEYIERVGFIDFNRLLEICEMKKDKYPATAYGQMIGSTFHRTPEGKVLKKVNLNAYIIPGRDDGACLVTVEGMLPLLDLDEDVDVPLYRTDDLALIYPEDIDPGMIVDKEDLWNWKAWRRKVTVND